jgi:hypothetical protein
MNVQVLTRACQYVNECCNIAPPDNGKNGEVQLEGSDKFEEKIQ